MADATVIKAEFDETVAAIATKAPAVVQMMQDMDARETQLAEQIKKLQAEKKMVSSFKEDMKCQLTEAVKATGQKTIATDQFIFTLKGNGGQQPLEITGEVPDSFQKVVMEVDKKKIRTALEAGEKLEFAHLGERGSHLVVTKRESLGYDKTLDAKDIVW